MKILFITDGLYPFVIGGMQKHATYLLRQFAATEHEVHVITANMGHPVVEDYAAKIFGNVKHDNITVELIDFPRLPAFPGHYIMASWLFSKKVSKAIASTYRQYDLIYAKGFTSWHMLSKKPADLPPVVVQLHGFEMFQKPYGVKDRIVKYMLRMPVKRIVRNADAIFTYGGKVKKIVLSLRKNSRSVYEQYGAVDDFWLFPEPANKSNGNVRKFLYVARYEFRKGYHILKPVLEKLIAEGADFNIDIVGDIPDNLKIKNDAVTYHGNLKAEKLKSLKESCEILVVCSLAEGFPTILVEAMARGLAPLASDVGAVSAVVNNENGWLIEPGSEEDLFQAMTLAITTSADALSDKQKKSRDAISRDFKWDSMFNVLVSHLELIVNDYRKRPSR